MGIPQIHHTHIAQGPSSIQGTASLEVLLPPVCLHLPGQRAAPGCSLRWQLGRSAIGRGCWAARARGGMLEAERRPWLLYTTAAADDLTPLVSCVFLFFESQQPP